MEQGDMILVHRSDILKVLDTVKRAVEFHQCRDQMNAALHLAQETRLSPLTSELLAAEERLATMH
jgi:hypothetical protein